MLSQRDGIGLVHQQVHVQVVIVPEAAVDVAGFHSMLIWWFSTPTPTRIQLLNYSFDPPKAHYPDPLACWEWLIGNGDPQFTVHPHLAFGVDLRDYLTNGTHHPLPAGGYRGGHGLHDLGVHEQRCRSDDANAVALRQHWRSLAGPG